MTELAAWIARTHERAHQPGCTWLCDPDVDAARLKKLARKGHEKYAHLGNVENCQDPHDVLCKALDWSAP